MSVADFQFDEAPPERPRLPYRPQRWTTSDRTFWVLRLLGVLLMAVGLGYGASFWWFWTTGARATAVVVHKEERIVGWVAFGGRPYPKVATGFHWQFVDADGNVVRAVYWINSPSDQWQFGEAVAIMYAPTDASISRPSSLSYYLKNDTPWALANLAVLAGLGAVVVGHFVVRRVYRRHAWLGLATQERSAPIGPDDEQSLSSIGA